jgi:hypothetical protein
MKVPSNVVILALISSISPGVLAQDGGIAQGRVIVTTGAGSIGVLGSPQARPTVPYSADQEMETTRTLVDGTHIIIKNHSRLYRDSLGRTRIEMFANSTTQPRDDSQPTGINIFDPVDGVQYFLNPRNHTGTRNNFMRPAPPANSPAPAAPLTPPTPKELSPRSHSEDLGVEMVEGIWARHTRMTITIPVNAQGNDRPMVETMERWFSEELQVDVLVKRSDPRNGDSIQRLTNIDRSEPDAALFRPPADYVVTESPRWA